MELLILTLIGQSGHWLSFVARHLVPDLLELQHTCTVNIAEAISGVSLLVVSWHTVLLPIFFPSDDCMLVEGVRVSLNPRGDLKGFTFVNSDH